MSAEYRRLLRWYPARWRERNGDVLLGTLLDAAEADGRAGPSRTEAWSLRAHGLAERLDCGVAFILSVIALAVFAAAGAAMLLSSPMLAAVPIGSILIGPALLSVATLALMRSRGLLAAPTVLLTAGTALVAWVLAFLAQLSWSVGFDEADAGVAHSAFGSAFIPLGAAAWLAGSAALVPAIAATRGRRSRGRIVIATLIGIAAPPTLGLLLLTPTNGALLAVPLVYLARPRIRRRAAASRGIRDARDRRRSTLPLSAATAALGSLAVALALGGAPLFSGDGTRAMNVGLGGGALAGIPLVIALGTLGVDRWGRWFSAPAALAVAALIGVSGSQFVGADSVAQWPLVMVAAGLLGVAGGIVAAMAIPTRPTLRILIAIGVAGAFTGTLGAPVAIMLPFIAPVGAIALITVTARQQRAPAR